MVNKDKKRPTYKILTRLFELIQYMPEAERKELQSAIIANLTEAESRQILPGLIANISESKRWELLEKLEKWQQSKFAEMRDHPRRPSFIPVECSRSLLSPISLK